MFQLKSLISSVFFWYKIKSTKDYEYVLVKTIVWSCKVTSPLCRISCESHAVHKELVCQATMLASNSCYKKPFSSTEITSFHSSSSHAEQLDWRSCARWTTQLSKSNPERLATVQTYWERLEVQWPHKEGHWPSKPRVGLFILPTICFSVIYCTVTHYANLLDPCKDKKQSLVTAYSQTQLCPGCVLLPLHSDYQLFLLINHKSFLTTQSL